MLEVILGVAMFTAIVLILVLVILAAKASWWLAATCRLPSTTRRRSKFPPGASLLGALSDAGIFVSSACGGGGTCAQCEVKVLAGGGDILPTERAHINRREEKEGCRLSCQVAVKQDMRVEVPPEAFDTKKWLCKVKSNHNVATFIKEFVLELPRAKRSISKRVVTFRSNARPTRLPTKILKLKRSTTRIGTSTTFGNSCRRLRSR